MTNSQTAAEAEIEAAIAAAVEKTIADPDLRRSITHYLIGAHKDLPPEERTGSLIDAILQVQDDEDR